jgi:hypothetical protein
MLKMRTYVFLLIIVLSINYSYSQNVGVNADGSVPDNSAMLDIKSLERGLLIPRIDIPDLDFASPVTTPAVSLIVYNINIASGLGFYYWSGTRWERLLDSIVNADQDWYEVGGTDAPNNINDDIYSFGNVGIGTNAPTERLELNDGGLKINDDFGIGFNATNPYGGNVTNTGIRIFHESNLFGAGIGGLTFERTDNVNVVPTGGMVFANKGTSNTSTPAFVIHGNNKLSSGIGVALPKTKFEIHHNISGEYVMNLFNDAEVSGNGLLIESNGGNNDDTLLRIKTDINGTPQNAMVVIGDRRVGINHDNPNTLTKLDVNGYMIGQNFFFMARTDAGQSNYADNVVVTFAQVYDPHGNYDPATNRYTAPISGYYFFTTTITFEGSGGDDDTQYINFQRNGVTFTSSEINPEAHVEADLELSQSFSSIIYLTAGQNVRVTISSVGAGNAIDMHHKHFMGYLISK